MAGIEREDLLIEGLRPLEIPLALGGQGFLIPNLRLAQDRRPAGRRVRNGRNRLSARLNRRRSPSRRCGLPEPLAGIASPQSCPLPPADSPD